MPGPQRCAIPSARASFITPCHTVTGMASCWRSSQFLEGRAWSGVSGPHLNWINRLEVCPSLRCRGTWASAEFGKMEMGEGGRSGEEQRHRGRTEAAQSQCVGLIPGMAGGGGGGCWPRRRALLRGQAHGGAQENQRGEIKTEEIETLKPHPPKLDLLRGPGGGAMGCAQGTVFFLPPQSSLCNALGT